MLALKLNEVASLMALEGPLEVAHYVYDTISSMLESDSFKYIPPQNV